MVSIAKQGENKVQRSNSLSVKLSLRSHMAFNCFCLVSWPISKSLDFPLDSAASPQCFYQLDLNYLSLVPPFSSFSFCGATWYIVIKSLTGVKLPDFRSRLLLKPSRSDLKQITSPLCACSPPVKWGY